MKNFPDFSIEKIYWEKGFETVGIDEVGRGAFAGPVTVAGVVFKSNLKNKLLGLGINDSKKLSPAKRGYLFSKIKEMASFFHISFTEVPIINNIGIGKATFLGMKEVADTLSKKITKPFFLIDAFEIPNSIYLQKGIIRGDSLSISIAAASIIAKVARDELMVELSKNFPLYGFDKHKGYGTLFHRTIISRNGISQEHRTEFCRKTLALA